MGSIRQLHTRAASKLLLCAVTERGVDRCVCNPFPRAGTSRLRPLRNHSRPRTLPRTHGFSQVMGLTLNLSSATLPVGWSWPNGFPSLSVSFLVYTTGNGNPPLRSTVWSHRSHICESPCRQRLLTGSGAHPRPTWGGLLRGSPWLPHPKDGGGSGRLDQTAPPLLFGLF